MDVINNNLPAFSFLFINSIDEIKLKMRNHNFKSGLVLLQLATMADYKVKFARTCQKDSNITFQFAANGCNYCCRRKYIETKYWCCGWHHQFHLLMKRKKPPFWQFLMVIRGEQATT